MHLDPREPIVTILTGPSLGNEHDLICLSHVRWDLVFQRPQHLLTRCARDRRVFFVEPPVPTDGPPRLDVTARDGNVWVAVPHVPAGLAPDEVEIVQKGLLDELLDNNTIRSFILWVDSPMALGFARQLHPAVLVYDCMDELACSPGAPDVLCERELELLGRADLVFTGGRSLYEAKRDLHPSVYAFPNSVDYDHFNVARRATWVTEDPADQADIPRPRIGYFGVIDERVDTALLAAVADARPDWQLVMIGPVARVDPASLPRRPNIHWLGARPYAELPRYIAGWDLAMLPFVRTEATRLISPTKLPEYLAAGKPVISTSIGDVVRSFASEGLVTIADTGPDFVAAAEAELRNPDREAWLRATDAFLVGSSWDATWDQMNKLIAAALPVEPSNNSAHTHAHRAAG